MKKPEQEESLSESGSESEEGRMSVDPFSCEITLENALIFLHKKRRELHSDGFRIKKTGYLSANIPLFYDLEKFRRKMLEKLREKMNLGG